MLVVLVGTPDLAVILKQARVDVSLGHIVGEGNQEECYAYRYCLFRPSYVSQDVHDGVSDSASFLVFLYQEEI